jgi:type I restriction enzyme S subunit
VKGRPSNKLPSKQLNRNGAARHIAAWPSQRIDSVGEVQGGRQRSEKIVNGNPCKYLRVANVFDGYIDFSNVYDMLFTDREKDIYSLRPGDILLNEGQSLELVGRSAIYDGTPETYCFQNTLIRFRPSSQIMSEFAQQVFQFYLTTGVFAAIAARTTSIAHLGVERFASLRIPVPPLPEQKAIAAVLSAWDRAMGQTATLIAAKERLKQGLMQQLLSGRRRFPEFRRQELQPTRLNAVLSKVARAVTVEPSKSYREIGIRSHGKGIFHKDPVEGRSLGNKRVYEVVPGCLTLNIVFAWERALAVTTNDEVGMIASHRFPMFQPDRERIEIEFVLHYMLSHVGHNVLKLASPGGAGRNRTISQEQFLKTSIPLPSVSEQHKIVTFINAADSELRSLRIYLEALKKQKRGLMQQLLTGQLRVPKSLLEKGAKS